MVLNIAKSKCDQLRHGKRVHIHGGKSTKTCPVQVMREILARTPERPDAHVIQKITAHTRDKKFTGQQVSYNLVRNIIKRALTAIGINAANYSTHSLRSGGATAAAAAKIEPRLMQRHGRWARTDSMNTYVDDELNEKLRVSKAVMSSK
jgi:hypothetical protein